MNRLRLIKTGYIALAALMFAGCTSDEWTDNTMQNLPEGKYPLNISSVSISAESSSQPWGANAPQSRVTESIDGLSSSWQGGEVIKVNISAGGLNSAKELTCTLKSDGTVDTYNEQLYWQTKQSSTVNSWYSNISGQSTETDNTKTISFSDQSSGLAYVMKADELIGQNYQSGNLSLNFKHKLAKVRVKLTGAKASDVTSVSLKSYTQCTITQGEVSNPNAEGYISMRQPIDGGEYWEANVVPGIINKTGFLQVNGVALDVETTIMQLEAGKYYNFEVEVKKGQTQAKPNEDGSYTIEEGDNVYIEGEVKGSITIQGTADVELRNVRSNCSAPIHVTSGTATITVVGQNNSLESSNLLPGIWVDGENTNVKIIGQGNESCLTIRSSAAAIGTKSGPLAKPKCGNITIENIKIIATVGSGAAVIGFGAAYGAGTSQKIGDITITNSEIEATLSTGLSHDYGAVIGGCGSGEGNYTMGNICITTSDSSITPQDYFSNCTCGNVWVGFPSSSYSYTVNSFKIYWNAQLQPGYITK